MLKRTRSTTGKIMKYIIPCAFLGLAAVIFVASQRLESKNARYEVKLEKLKEELAAEEARSEEIEELRIYMETDKYVEEIAKKRLGLVYEDEIVFKARED